MNRFVGVVELVDTYVSGAYGEIFEGSSPFSDILFKILAKHFNYPLDKVLDCIDLKN